LVRYAARGPLAQSRLSRQEDGRYRYECKKGKALVLTAAQLVKRLIALVPPQRVHLTTFHGVLGPNARLRPWVTTPPVVEKQRTLRPRPANEKDSEAKAPRRPRLDWATLQRRTFGVDVWTCRCGGKREVLALITRPSTAQKLLGNLGLLPLRSPLPVAQSPPRPQLSLEFCAA
ncbi:MAG: transposase, partial [Myxococcota bacterium]